MTAADDAGAVRDRPDLSGDVERQVVAVDGGTVTITLTGTCVTCGGPIFAADPARHADLLDGRNAAYGRLCWRCVNGPKG